MDKPGINKNLLLIIIYTPFDKKILYGIYQSYPKSIILQNPYKLRGKRGYELINVPYYYYQFI